ncbi:MULTISPECIES: FadR/GntR family transcriptional regulator [Streptacidiphilus]|uniref:FadR/GntR family transcriptional regulator n=1 Tax=Streptacidiphilus cavernicola TaxID=3342716 RepID=A0ABV6UUX2_9ACTN|nr:FCD domain-containing protein [Streptacidiphilus jeojiense]
MVQADARRLDEGPLDSALAASVRAPKTGELVARRLRRMIADGELKNGDFLPHEAQLLEHFGVSRPTLREAVRVLESEGLVELRRGSRTGARVRIPGPEAVALPAALQLQIGGATLADVYTARSAIEPTAARLLALTGDEERYAALEAALEGERDNLGSPAGFAVGSARFHLRMVQLAGNQTLALMAGMLHEIILRQTRNAVRSSGRPGMDEQALKSYEKLIRLVRAGRGEAAETFWRKHLAAADEIVLAGQAATRVIDITD